MTGPLNNIQAGSVDTFSRNPNDWVFLDIGFAQHSTRSCGLAVHDRQPIEVAWSSAVQLICEINSTRTAPLHLMIEAPLSMAFCKSGSPTGRSFEPPTHVWYQRGGASVLLSAALLLSQLARSAGNSVRLFEAFVTNAGQEQKQRSTHAEDAASMRKQTLGLNSAKLLPPSAIRRASSDSLKSSMQEFGLNFGIPPVLVASKLASTAGME